MIAQLPTLTDLLNQYLDRRGYSPGARFRTKHGAGSPDVGWKLHVSATEDDRLKIAKRVLPILIANNVEHKVDVSAGVYDSGRPSQLGKFITIYPTDDATLVTVGRLIDQALRGCEGFAIQNEHQLGETGLLYMRHGQLTGLGFRDPRLTNPRPLGGRRYTVACGGADYDIEVVDGVVFMLHTDGQLYPAVIYGGVLRPDPREDPNPFSVPLPAGLEYADAAPAPVAAAAATPTAAASSAAASATHST